MQTLKLGVIFGGVSTEHEVSKVSATSVIENLDKTKYEIYPIYIDPKGNWHHYKKPIEQIATIQMGEEIAPLETIENVIQELSKLDVVFPVLHGIGGEDGTIQGLFELLKLPYVGCGVLSSSVGMDKVYTKILFDKANLKQAPYQYIRKTKEGYVQIDENFNEKKSTLEKIAEEIEKKLAFPVFIKPSNSGSSVGIRKANSKQELIEAIQYASNYDNKIVIEQGINAREVECAVLGNEEIKTSCVGEILPADQFYSFDAKYQNAESKIEIPAKLDQKLEQEVQQLAKRAFKAIDAKGLSRVDFFIEKETNQIYINEINTLPGFTKISMYPKLFEQVGISYTNLLDKLIQLAIEK